MSRTCENSERLWNALQKEAQEYRDAMEKQFKAISKMCLQFPRFEKEVRAARKRQGIAKAAVVNHHRTHGCQEQNECGQGVTC